MLLNGFRHGAEDHAGFRELFLEGGDDRDAVEHGIDGNACEHFLFGQRNAELLIGFEKFRVHLVEAVELRLLLRRRIIIGVLEVDRRIGNLRPGRLGHGQPAAEGRKPPFEQPFGLVLLRGNETNRILRQAQRGLFGFYVGREAVFILLDLTNGFDGFPHGSHINSPPMRAALARPHLHLSSLSLSRAHRHGTSSQRNGPHRLLRSSSRG